MKNLKLRKLKKWVNPNWTFFLLLSVLLHFNAEGQDKILRRPISPSSPMWLVHIDTWNYPDPQKIIDLIPQDIRPYVVMNISLSISHDVTTSQFKVAEYGYEIAKSWLRTCAQNQMWATVQVASGGMHQLKFPEDDLAVYEEFFRDYPNFLGFNYAEQFWGFDDATDPVSAKWTDRINHFTDLLKLSNKYGGYLVVSWCGNQYSPSINPIAMLKLNSGFAAACKQFTKNFILCEKYTTTAYKSDMESLCLGAYLSGYSGQYGIRYDNTGWTDSTATNANFTLATAGAVHLEHMMLTGQTVIDGPEIIWMNCFKENSTSTTSDSYTRRNWGTFAHFDNVMVEMFRKILDGTVRIPSRKEVIDRTKYVIINNVNSGSNDSIYSSPKLLFDGLYRMDGDGYYDNNKTFFKKTGRYPTIPTVYQLNDADAKTFQYQINKSTMNSRWSTVNNKVNELNTIFPKEYLGDIYAGRIENGWVTYNPNKTKKAAKGSIPFKYNTCDSMALAFSQYTAGVVKEYTNNVTFYLNNYDDEINTGLKADTIWIYGSAAEPTWSYVERGSHQASTIVKSWSNGVFYLAIRHNGPLDITVNCSGTATDRLTSYTNATLTSPVKPAIYTGPRQYEAECFDRKSVSNVVTSGYSGTIRNYTGQGYIQFGTNSAASIRDTVNVLKNGIYKLQTKYSVAGGTVTTIDLYVNGTKVATPTFSQTTTESNWAINTQYVTLNAGNNSIIFKANATGAYGLNFDNIVVSLDDGATIYDFTNDVASTSAITPAAQFITVQSGSAGVVSFTDANSQNSNSFKTYSAGATNGTGVADLDLFPPLATDYYVVWKEYFGSTGAKNGILLRGTGSNGSCAYATGMKQGYLCTVENNKDNTVTLKTYLADAAGITEKTSYTTSFQILSNKPSWYRALVVGSNVIFECSGDSTTWVGSSSTAFTDGTYTSGSTQLLWGFGSNNLSWVADNIAYKVCDLSASKYALSGFSYALGSGPSLSQSFVVSGNSLTDNIMVSAPNNYEVSLSSGSDYTSSLVLNQSNGVVPSTTVYVRLKAGLGLNASYNGAISVSSSQIPGAAINLAGSVTPANVSKIYNFSDDVATTSASTPPALNTAIGSGNLATAGVVSFTDLNGVTSNMLKPYSGGARNGTGVIDLSLFSKKSTDYSVTWKQCIGVISKDYKVGMLLRGDISKIGDATTGYVQGIMQGYVFLPYTVAAGGTQFRIYKSTSSTSLTTLVNTTVSTLTPTLTQPVWYRASVSGTTSVALKLEYSTDSITWSTGSAYTDASSVFTAGATQFVWGLNTNNFDHYLDNVVFNGIEEGLSASSPTLDVSQSVLSGFSTYQNMGASAAQSFTVSGTLLTNNVVVTAPANYEISLNPLTGYTSSYTIVPSSGNVATTLYVRLQSGLAVNSYTGDVTIASTGLTSKTVFLSGTVNTQSTVSISTASLSGFIYPVGNGPSAVQSFSVSGSSLSENITVNAPEHYEVSLSSGSGYASSVILTQNSGSVTLTNVFVRLKAGLPLNSYNEEIFTTSAGSVKRSVSLNGAVAPQPNVVVNQSSLSGFNYVQGSGPSASQSFTVSGNSLTDNIVVNAPANYEVSVNATSGYASSVTLIQSDGTLDQTTVYVRLMVGLVNNGYSGDISITSTGASDKIVSLSGTVLPQPSITVSETTLSGFSYSQGSGPSASQSFTVSGSALTDNIVVSVPANYEISLTSGSGYTTSLIITGNGNVAQVTIYVRLAAGLSTNLYNGDISITSVGALAKSVSLSGSVSTATDVRSLSQTSATIVSQEYYTIMGQRIYHTDNLRGFLIIRNYMSDGTVITQKIRKE